MRYCSDDPNPWQMRSNSRASSWPPRPQANPNLGVLLRPFTRRVDLNQWPLKPTNNLTGFGKHLPEQMRNDCTCLWATGQKKRHFHELRPKVWCSWKWRGSNSTVHLSKGWDSCPLCGSKHYWTISRRRGTGLRGATEKPDTYCGSSCTSILQHKVKTRDSWRDLEDNHRISHKSNTERKTNVKCIRELSLTFALINFPKPFSKAAQGKSVPRWQQSHTHFPKNC